MNTNVKVKLKGVRISYPKLFTAERMANGEGNPKFTASFLIPKNDQQVLTVRDAMKSAAKAKWADKSEGILKGLVAENKVCLHDGDNKELDGYAGCFYVSTSSRVMPKVYDRDKNEVHKDTGLIYSGCYVDVIFSVYPQDNNFGRRINASLEGVRFVRDGDAFGSAVRVTADDFDDLTVDDASDIDVSDLL